jgi:RNA polymerase sigma factor (sigma-70 family)
MPHVLSISPSETSTRPEAPGEPGRSFEDGAAFSRAVEPHLPRLVRTARRFLHSEDLAWDAVQETLLRIWTHGWLPEDPTGVLIELVRRSSLHQRRCLTRREHHEDRFRAAASPCCGDDPLLDLASGEETERVLAAVEAVSEDLQSVFVAHALEGRSYRDIAEGFGLPIGTVRSRISRARARIREELEKGECAA